MYQSLATGAIPGVARYRDNEVWLLAAGGETFAAFPGTYAVLFSALYTPLMMHLFALILRGISFEIRDLEEATWWRKTWDVCHVLLLYRRMAKARGLVGDDLGLTH